MVNIYLGYTKSALNEEIIFILSRKVSLIFRQWNESSFECILGAHLLGKSTDSLESPKNPLTLCLSIAPKNWLIYQKFGSFRFIDFALRVKSFSQVRSQLFLWVVARAISKN